ncbi:Ferredoxin-thioredoxin reductase, variable chain [Apostasia shenzhenica]|uniref:Ferredoxin-thioredoxin reductase, variable chain n=1 Tax=Apostasia shenzhenica TaxID=1088818 RepID=A0A2I0AIY4_9ASPA|nr:Ferredoxin-thioredoxin reductase, variable chain [Apostasia shenzhenica]
MPTAAAATSASPLAVTLFRRPVSLLLRPRSGWSPVVRWKIFCEIALTTDVSSSSPEAVVEEEAEAAAKIGARIRVKAPLKVYHVSKVPDLDLCGMEGVIKQYAGLWKGKRISANLPFKVEFLLAVEGQEKPIKFAAHLREDEFEYLSSSD